METVLFLIIGWSITSILVNGSIFDSLRVYLIVKFPSLSKLMTCMQCSGFWVGFIIGLFSISGLIVNPIGDLISQDSKYLSGFLSVLSYSFLNSGISVLLNSLVIFLVKERLKVEQDI